MTKINTRLVYWGRLQLWLNKMHMTWICMCGNPSAWVGFVCWGESPSLSDAQPGVRAANGQDLDIVLPWSAGWGGFTPSLSSSPLVRPLLLLPGVEEGRSHGLFIHSAWRKRLPLQLQNFCFYFLLGAIVQNSWGFTNTLQGTGLTSLPGCFVNSRSAALRT